MLVDLGELNVLYANPHLLDEQMIRRGVSLKANIPEGIVEVRSPMAHLMMGSEVWAAQQTWHKDQEKHEDPTMMAMDIVCWASRSGTIVRDEYADVQLEPWHVYRWDNLLHFHRQPELTEEDLQHRWYARAWVLR